jgi:hypothetical protein
MAESENTPMDDTMSGAPSDGAEALVPAETWTEEGASGFPEPALATDSPFRDDQLLFFEGGLIRNELADAQADPEAARSLAARHWSRLFYDPNAPWRGRTPYPQVGVLKADKPGR